jgi:hypothetical protein
MDENDRLTRVDDALINLAIVVSEVILPVSTPACPQTWSRRAGGSGRSTDR